MEVLPRLHEDREKLLDRDEKEVALRVHKYNDPRQ